MYSKTSYHSTLVHIGDVNTEYIGEEGLVSLLVKLYKSYII